MQAVLLVAGKSTRTYPLTITKPKPLLKIANVSLIEHNLEQLQDLVSEVILVVGFKKEMIKEKIGNKFGKLKIKYVEQKKQNGTGHAILSVKSHIKNKFMVLNGDDLYSKRDLKNCLKHDYCVLVKEVGDLSRFGQIILKDNAIVDIKEKPKGKNKGLANTGVYVFDKNIFLYNLQKSKRGEFEITDYVKYLIKNHKVNYEIVKDYWFPITYPWNLLDANEFFMSKIKTNVQGKVEKCATLKGKMIIEKNTLVKAGAYIEGPVIIGENCVIGPNCFIRSGTVIGDNSKIGNAVEIKNSIIGDNTCIGHLSYIGDSILGDNVNLGAGTITANLRHDNTNIKNPIKKELVNTGRRKLGTIIGDNVHTGIHTSIYPGRKIWPDKTTLPGEIIKKDVGGW